IKNLSGRSATPLLIVFCPARPEQKGAFDDVERGVTEQLEKLSSVHVIASIELFDLYPVADFYDARGDELGCVPYTQGFFTELATIIARKLHALQRAPHKVIVLDCDQTLWGGVCGEDGARGICVDAPRQALQSFMRAQQGAGRLLAVCSKNN